MNHVILFEDGPLRGEAMKLTGTIPFVQFQIGGDMKNPIFHMYTLSENGTPQVEGMPVLYKFKRTLDFKQMASLIA